MKPLNLRAKKPVPKPSVAAPADPTAVATATVPSKTPVAPTVPPKKKKKKLPVGGGLAAQLMQKKLV